MNLRLACLAAVVLGGCASKTDKLNLEAVDALGRCDIRAANVKFTEAYDGDPDDANAALGFALTDLALLPEAPEVTAATEAIGFTGALDVQLLVFGPEGVLARAARMDTCESLRAFVRANIPYPPVAVDGPDPYTVVRSGATGDDVVRALAPLAGRLEKIARALETAASATTDPVTIEGGCGLGKAVLQAPELYLLAAVVEVTRGVLLAADGYDNGFSLALLLDERDASVAAKVADLNAHVLRVRDATKIARARDVVRHAIELTLRAAEVAPAAGTVANGLLDWSFFPDTMAADVSRLATSALAAMDQAAPLADFTPPFLVDVSGPFRTPMDTTGAAMPLFVVEQSTEPGFEYIDLAIDEDALEALTGPYVTIPDGVEWSPSDRWDAFDSDPFVEPARRYESVYGCDDSPLPL